MRRVVGIDLGTTNSLVATMERDRPAIIPNRAGQRLTPSVVGLDRHDKLHVGESAKNQLVLMPERTVAEVKRKMGSGEQVRLGERSYSPTEISGLILKALKEDAERHLGGEVEEAVVTVPAYFTDAQRQATKDAGELAGLHVERILNEPTAAALAYGIDRLDAEQYVLVFDLGGGTFDVSVLEMFQGVIDVKAAAGDNALGGSDFDRAVAAWLEEQLEKMHGVSIRGDLGARARLKAAAEAAKIQLSSLDSVPVLVPFLTTSGSGPVSLEVELTRARLEELIGDRVRATLGPIEAALRDAKLDRKAISDIVLVGGSSRLPLVRRLVAEFFGKEPRSGVNPDEAVALGAAIQAGLKSGAISAQRGIMITDVSPFTLGVEVMERAGSQMVAGLFSPIIPRNTTIPVSRAETYSTTADGQRSVEIKVYQGEAKTVRSNTFLDQYTVEGIPPGPAGSERVAVTFSYDINGILNVKTKILSTGKEAALVIDKSAQRMTAQEREQARGRLEREWHPEQASAAPGAPAPKPAAESPVGPAAAASGASPGAAGQPSQDAGGLSSLRALISAGEEKIERLEGEPRERLTQLLAQAKRAAAVGDRAEIARLDAKLTDTLFEML